ncbi:CBL-interacting serine/threonine-protein kinase 1-like isoform X2 [Carya illinoinensis]|uniref:CBL-interacting serine/threonine-protein kinase 1-like isoform X2 n=1 Tax=Carya illinoinensis TaxID=32201 RepID=UPI001C718203|nr:CBL-interacting serine/threonine-protein kinase 1-like isoform X2 [Carya illinoinensis]
MVRKEAEREGMRLGKYELGRTLGEGNFGKVKLAKNIETGQSFAVKILEKTKIINLKITDQVLASKTKIYMVLEYVTGGELFDRIASKGRLKENVGRKVFQQLIDAVSYCHTKGVFHRDLKLENVLIDARGNIKISDFGLSALPQHLRGDGLLHTTCGSPNYIAPEILANRGYDGATSDIWSCGVILYVILTGQLPFDDRNLAVLYQKIFKGDTQIPTWLSPGAQKLIRRILDPNPLTRITTEDIKADEWFKQGYSPANPDDDEDIHIDDEAFSIHEVPSEGDKSPGSPTLINAFQLIGMSSCLDLSGFFEKEDVSERKIRFTSNHNAKDLLEKIENIVTEMGFSVLKKNGRLKVMQEHKGLKSMGSLSVAAEVFEISPSLYVVELRKSYGDSSVYRQLCKKLSNELGVSPNRELLTAEL